MIKRSSAAASCSKLLEHSYDQIKYWRSSSELINIMVYRLLTLIFKIVTVAFRSVVGINRLVVGI